MYVLMFIFAGLCYSQPIFYPVFTGLALIFFTRKFLKLKAEKIDLDVRFLILMSYALPFSWRSLIGSNYGSFPLSWFIIFGICYLVSIMLINNKIIYKKNIFLLIMSFITIILSFVPLLYSSKIFFSQAITQFIVLTFNNVLIFASIFRYNTLKNQTVALVKRGYITGAVLTSIMLILQFSIFKMTGFEFGAVNFLLNRELFYFLFTDISHGTLYLATAAFWILYDTKNKKGNTKNYILFILIALASAITSARTGLFVLFVFSFMFILIGQRGLLRKFMTLVTFGVGGYLAFQLLQSVRDLSTISDVTSGSGRLLGYEFSLQLLKQAPMLGYGYSQNYLAFLLGQPIPHLSILQYALHGGMLFSLILFLNQFLIWIDAVQKKTVFSWLIAIVLVGTCLIPDLFATRFITLICILSISSQKFNKETLINK
ncbi:hypothetical protein ACWOAH_11205 [Vagococcus vulneris]|uniref:O-antigen polymerase n=1 Tax=Vagococcus vulneris TaxID=1977869 RepID=A0A429ZR59_9ENTE|nr:hypothetical protein [Vagococcus vulneris]RST96151.1 hypothetical protein CBF37_11225 [Vagococcus vulneris]